MSTEFLRLYHQLTRFDPKDPNPDIRYEKERREVLKTLGYQVAGVDQRIECSKYHGKMARRTLLEKKKLATVTDSAQESKKRMALHAVIVEADKLNGAVSQLTALLQANQPIPRQLWEELAPRDNGQAATISGSSTSRKLGATATSSSSSKSLSSRLPPIDSSLSNSGSRTSMKGESKVYTQTVPRPSANITKSFTTNLWTKAERDRLNQLYLEIKKPPSTNQNMWRVYYETVATRFLTFFPLRNLEEVIVKLEDMILMRKMKEETEGAYWDTFKKKKEDEKP